MKDFCYNVSMLVIYILTVVVFVLFVCMLVTIATGCRSKGAIKFLSVECVGTNVVITTEVPHLYEGSLEIDGLPYEHPITLSKEDFEPGPHVVTLTCVHVGPQPGPFHGYQAYGPVFTKTDVFEIEGEENDPPTPEDDDNNGHGDEDDHDDDSNPGKGHGDHHWNRGDDDD